MTRLLLATFFAATLTACPGSGGSAPEDAGPDVPDDASDAGADADAGACPNDLPDECPAPAPSYDAAVAPILARRCAPCHFPGGVEVQAHDFSTYEQVHAQAGTILGQIHACLMPPADAGQPTAEERLTLEGWLVCGAPRN
jgi:hypothetical protein